MGYNLLINGVYWVYKTHLLTIYQLPGTSKYCSKSELFVFWNVPASAPEKLTNVPLKRGPKKGLSSNHYFSGDVRSFSGGGGGYEPKAFCTRSFFNVNVVPSSQSSSPVQITHKPCGCLEEVDTYAAEN